VEDGRAANLGMRRGDGRAAGGVEPGEEGERAVERQGQRRRHVGSLSRGA
jgi:hypothetical protein